MPATVRSFDRMFDRTWRPGHPFRPRLSALRRWGIGILLVVLLVIIGGYWTLTDSRRVKAMAEAYLSQLMGGRVEVRHATLSIFEGLRLDGVKVYADPPPVPRAASSQPAGHDAPGSGQAQSQEGQRDDALVFSAATFLVKYNIESIFSGHLEATEILAIDPQVHLSEDVKTGQWNYQRLGRAHPVPPKGAQLPREMNIPRIILRNGTIIRSQSFNGARIAGAGGSTSIDGTLMPLAGNPSSCEFSLQTRGESDNLNAVVRGAYDTGTGQFSAQFEGLKLGPDVLVMLPRVPRQWGREHDLAGAVDIPEFQVAAPRDGQPATFRVVMNLKDGSMAVLSRELAAGTDALRVHTMIDAFDLMRAAGMNVRSSGLDLWDQDEGDEPDESAGFVDCLQSVFLPSLHLQHVTGQFVFTNGGIEVNKLHGELEGNAFDIDGHIDSYSPMAPAEISLRCDKLNLPDLPLYLGALPKPARDVLLHLRPWGHGNLWARYTKLPGEERPRVQGSLDITDGFFCFDRFPYPLQHAAGTISFGPDPAHPGQERCDIVGLRGYGVPGGPNEHRTITVDCSLSPMTPDAETRLTVRGRDISSEPALCHALPPEAQQALELFDAAHTRKLPKFRGDFSCTVFRPYGPYMPVRADIELALADGEGDFKFFPYPLHDLRGKLRITGNSVEIDHATAVHDTAAGPVAVGIDGSVKYGRDEPLMPNLTITGANLPIDDDLLAALPATVRHKLRALGLKGLLSVEGNITRAVGASAAPLAQARVQQPDAGDPADDFGKDIALDFRLTLDKGSIAPPLRLSAAGAHKPSSLLPPMAAGALAPMNVLSKAKDHQLEQLAMTDVRGTGRLITGPAGGTLAISDFHARRGDCDLAGTGLISWKADTAEGGAKNAPAKLAANHPGGSEIAAEETPADLFGDASLSFDVSAKNLALDDQLYAMLPADAREAWDSVHPSGTVDAELQVNLPSMAHYVASRASHAPSPATTAPIASTQPAGNFELTIHPIHLSATIRAVPYRLDDIAGTIHINPRETTLTNMVAHHGPGKIYISGIGTSGDPTTQAAQAAAPPASQAVIARNAASIGPTVAAAKPPASANAPAAWHLQISARDLPADAELRHALPPTFAKLLEGLKLDGKISFDLSKLSYQCPPTADGEPDIALGGKLWLQDGVLQPGVPVTEFNGVMTFDATAHNGELSELTGAIDASHMQIGGRDVTNLHTDLFKPADRQAIRFGKIEAQVAGGELAGKVELAFPDNGVNRYALDLVVRDAEVAQLTRDTAHQIHGNLNISLSLEGAWDDSNSRRGRGDVVVNGHELYQIPLMMGLLQITNLQLPISSPFNQATARYSVEGPRVTFDQIVLKSSNMLMQGSGSLDYATRKVSLTFTTDNPNSLKLPVIDELLTTARHELLQIHVTGTLEDPKVSASTMDTITTTVDQVTKATRGNKAN